MIPMTDTTPTPGRLQPKGPHPCRVVRSPTGAKMMAEAIVIWKTDRGWVITNFGCKFLWYIYMYSKKTVCVNVCVDHLKRCKTSKLFIKQGVAADHLGPLPTKTPIWSGDTDWDANLRTCTNFHFRQWQPAKPRTGMSFFGFQLHQDLPQNFDVNRFQSNVRFSQSELLLTSSDGTVAFCKDKERIHLHWFSRLFILFFLAVWKGLFCARLMHSTTKFAMLFLSKCVIPAVYVKLAGTLRGKPFQANNWQ